MEKAKCGYIYLTNQETGGRGQASGVLSVVTFFFPKIFLQILFLFIYLFIHLFIFGCVGSSLLCAGFLQQQRVAATLHCGEQASHWGGVSLWSTGFRHMGFSSCGMQAQQLCLVGSRAQAQYLWLTGLVDPQHVGSSRTRACCATKEVPESVKF